MKTKIAKVYKGRKEMSLGEIVKELGLKGVSKEDIALRLTGNHCSCGEGNGEFDLLPKNDPACLDGGKRYMVCRKCGCWSHLQIERSK